MYAKVICILYTALEILGAGSLRAWGCCRGLKVVLLCFEESASYSLVQTFCSRMCRLVTVHSVTDRWTNRPIPLY